MPNLLTADLHLTDNPSEEYRWGVFEHLMFWVECQVPLKNVRIYILGDLCDRKDRHSAALLNRMIGELMRLVDAGANVTIIMGNHDKPLNGSVYWGVLNELRSGTDIISGISFITEPRRIADLLLLPYSDNPAEEWADIDFNQVTAAFIHQTVSGCTGNNGIVLNNPKMLKIPTKVNVYSGDIHVPQVIGNVTYVGAPHPVAFGDIYPTRMLQLDDAWNVEKVIRIKTIQKLMLNIRHPNELDDLKTWPGDQAKVRCAMQITDLDAWPAWQQQIEAWGKDRGVEIFSIEPEISGVTLATSTAAPEIRENDPGYILRMFADAEGIDDTLFDAGARLLKEVIDV